MPKVDISLRCLLWVALIFSISELGLITAAFSQFENGTFIRYSGRNGEITVAPHTPPPGVYSFLLFVSLWTIVLVPGLLYFSMSTRTRTESSPNRWLGPVTLTLNAVTMVFWISGFGGQYEPDFPYNALDIPGAILAFSCMLWCIFFFILLINILTATSALKSDRFGFGPMNKRSRVEPRDETDVEAPRYDETEGEVPRDDKIKAQFPRDDKTKGKRSGSGSGKQ